MYLDFYNLTQRPFKLTPDLHFFFKSRSQEKALAYLLYGIEQGEGFVAITGGVGYGKTTLIQRLIEEARKKRVEVNRIAAANVGAENILELVCASLDIPFENKGKVALFKSLEEYLLKRHKRNIRVLFVIDEAQTLQQEALEELRILSNIEVNGRAALQIFLVGQIELRDTLLLPKFEHLRQRIIASYHLEPLSRAEVEKYVINRLQVAGWENDPEIDPVVYDFIHEWTNGIPRKINLLCDRFMLLGYIEELHKLGEDEIVMAIKDMEKELGHQKPTRTRNPKNVAVAAKLDRKYRADKQRNVG